MLLGNTACIKGRPMLQKLPCDARVLKNCGSICRLFEYTANSDGHFWISSRFLAFTIDAYLLFVIVRLSKIFQGIVSSTKAKFVVEAWLDSFIF